MTGKTLGHYQVTEKLGAGGMGEVFRARDTRLGRDVALKFLPAALAGDSNSLARFEREAQLLAQLNHANIAAIHGLEEAEGQRFLVLEYVPGKNLQGPLPIEDAETAARQIIDALEEAHERGIMHRDLKPANIKITPDGKVKVLDFGLAKALVGDPIDEVAANSPTLAASALTRGAMLLGTAAYMSPEQARGKPVDKRSDIFSFGSVLFEILTGEQAFGGETISDSLAAILTKEPDQSLLPAAISSNLRNLLQRCLQKDPKKRLRDIGEARIILDDAAVVPQPPTPIPEPPARRRLLPWAVAALVTVLAALAGWMLLRAPAPVTPPVVHLTAPVPQLSFNSNIALSPDGSRLAYVAGSPPSLHVRMLDQLEGKAIAGTENALDPFFSPDGQWLGFFQQNKWKKVQVIGGATITLCDGTASPYGAGASWGADGTIFFGALNQGLSKVSAAGGAPQAVTTLDQKRGDRAHRWPQVLPGGEAVLYAAGVASFEDAKIMALSLNTGDQRVLVDAGTSPRYVATGPAAPGKKGTGHIIYWRSGSLFAVPFDLARLEVVGSPVPVLEGVQAVGTAGSVRYSVSDAGSLVYVPGGAHLNARNLVWVDRQGKAQPIPAPAQAYIDARLSPEGQRVAVNITAERPDIWVWDLPRGTMTKITFQGFNTNPVWAPDGKRVTFAGGEAGKRTIAWTPADGSGQPETLVQLDGRPTSWSPDGKLLALEGGPRGQSDLLLLPKPEGGAASAPAPLPFLQTAHNEFSAMFSPDGRWVAYTSFESGQPQIYVRPAAPDAGGQWLISTGPGAGARWASGGRELFYRGSGKVMAVAIEPGPAFRPGTPKELFTYNAYTSPYGAYDVSADGKRFLMITSGAAQQGAAAATPEIHFVLEWFEDIRRRVRAGG